MFRSLACLALCAGIAFSQSTQEQRARAAMADSLRRQQESLAKQMARQPAWKPAPGVQMSAVPISVTPVSRSTVVMPWKPVAACPPLAADWLEPEIERTASANDLPEGLLRAVASTESANVPCAVSSKGAMGLMQIMPDTAAYLGLADPFDARQNLNAGAKYLKQLLERYGGDVRSALGAYNAGPGAVDKFGGVPPYNETQDYVRKILSQLKPINQ